METLAQLLAQADVDDGGWGWWWFWVAFVVLLILLPLAYGTGYRGWGWPDPRRRRRGPGGTVAPEDELVERERLRAERDADVGDWGVFAALLWFFVFIAIAWLIAVWVW